MSVSGAAYRVARTVPEEVLARRLAAWERFNNPDDLERMKREALEIVTHMLAMCALDGVTKERADAMHQLEPLAMHWHLLDLSLEADRNIAGWGIERARRFLGAILVTERVIALVAKVLSEIRAKVPHPEAGKASLDVVFGYVYIDEEFVGNWARPGRNPDGTHARTRCIGRASDSIARFLRPELFPSGGTAFVDDVVEASPPKE